MNIETGFLINPKICPFSYMQTPFELKVAVIVPPEVTFSQIKNNVVNNKTKISSKYYDHEKKEKFLIDVSIFYNIIRKICYFKLKIHKTNLTNILKKKIMFYILIL
jgi:hypothetical protein